MIYRKNDISAIYRREVPISRRIIVATHRLFVRYIAEISSIYRKNKERYSAIIVCITFSQYCTSNIITIKKYALLFEENSSNNLDFPYYNYPPFNLECQSEAECRANFRVEKHHIPLVEDVLQIPQYFVCDQGTVCEGTEGLCMLLKRYSFPCRYSDMIPIFGRPVPELCMICNTVTDWIYANHSQRITQWNRTILNPLELEKYAEAVFNKGAPLSSCFGFVDGTVRPITRPGENQRLLYNGHKRVHGLKFQSVVLPNGLIAHLYGPVGKACY